MDEHRAETGDGRPLLTAMARGVRQRCPRCGQGRIFSGYIAVAERCAGCGLALGGHRADDLPPYLTIMIAGKASIAALLLVDRLAEPSLWALYAITLSVAVGLSLALLPPLKGLVIGVQWANEMHGFSPEPDPNDVPPPREGVDVP